MKINQLDTDSFRQVLLKCCASENWADQMLARRPYRSPDQLLHIARVVWTDRCTSADWLEAFAAHPRIGNMKSLAAKFGYTRKWASQEQAGLKQASTTTIKALAAANHLYESRFGYIFIVCATGKSAEEMLHILEARLSNSPEKELLIAAEEQARIIEIRLKKWLNE